MSRLSMVINCFGITIHFKFLSLIMFVDFSFGIFISHQIVTKLLINNSTREIPYLTFIINFEIIILLTPFIIYSISHANNPLLFCINFLNTLSWVSTGNDDHFAVFQTTYLAYILTSCSFKLLKTNVF